MGLLQISLFFGSGSFFRISGEFSEKLILLSSIIDLSPMILIYFLEIRLLVELLVAFKQIECGHNSSSNLRRDSLHNRLLKKKNYLSDNMFHCFLFFFFFY